ncbi:MAG: response regulator [Chromatiaceae bacterium]|nr:response regulator [Chromatiaceae bacterium]
MSIRTKFAVGLIFILVINLGAGLYGLYLHKQASLWDARIRESSSQIVATALSAQVHFKKQVQEWKNVLIRGQDPRLFDKYLGQFEAEEANTREAIGRLLPLLAQNDAARETTEKFLSAHLALGSQYRSALGFYEPENANPSLAVDIRVRGIDREPTDLIDEVVAAALAHKNRVLEQIDASTRGVEIRILVLMGSVMTGAVMLLIWLVDRTIGRPIATATAIAKRVSAGDFSTPIHVTGADENAQMLAAMKSMQENLAHSRESLKQSEEQIRLLLESAGEGIYGVSPDGRCMFCNPAAARMLGYGSPAELEGRDIHVTMHHSNRDGTPYPVEGCQALQPCRNGIPVHVDDEVFWRVDGTSFPVEYHSNPIYSDGTLMGAAVNFSDISERKRAEAELRKAHGALAEERANLAQRVRERTAELDRANEELARTAQAKDEFLAAMSHELRTPLTSILGLSETMGDGLLGRLTEQQAKATRTIHENGSHLLELINDVLDMSRVASGRVKLHWDQVPVNQLWDASLRLIRPGAKAKGLDVRTSIDPEVRLLRGDSRRLKQVLVNLLGNAVKFTPEGGTIGLDVVGDKARKSVRISVWDTGVGIPAEQRDRLFKPFVQLDSRLSRRYDGTGLGLALANGMAELHGGTIEVDSKLGEGSRFHVSLPWDPDAQSAARIPYEDDLSDEGGVEAPLPVRPSVLLVEDNESNQEMLSAYLQIKDCDVVIAKNGIEAIAKAKEQVPDVILMDVQMPEMDGLEATRLIRAEPALRRIPIIALTALAMPGDRERCLEVGMDDYLSKPLGLKELHRTLTNWVKRTRAS